jgi:hypothetical protein
VTNSYSAILSRQLDFVVEVAERRNGEIGELMVGPSSTMRYPPTCARRVSCSPRQTRSSCVGVILSSHPLESLSLRPAPSAVQRGSQRLRTRPRPQPAEIGGGDLSSEPGFDSGDQTSPSMANVPRPTAEGWLSLSGQPAVDEIQYRDVVWTGRRFVAVGAELGISRGLAERLATFPA